MRAMQKEVERVQSYEELLVLRKIAMKKVEKERNLAEVSYLVRLNYPFVHSIISFLYLLQTHTCTQSAKKNKCKFSYCV